MWLWVETNGIPFWGSEFTTHFRTYFSGWIESDVHWGLTDLDFDPWPCVKMGLVAREVFKKSAAAVAVGKEWAVQAPMGVP